LRLVWELAALRKKGGVDSSQERGSSLLLLVLKIGSAQPNIEPEARRHLPNEYWQ
jgi:hypothetical protein